MTPTATYVGSAYGLLLHQILFTHKHLPGGMLLKHDLVMILEGKSYEETLKSLVCSAWRRGLMVAAASSQGEEEGQELISSFW